MNTGGISLRVRHGNIGGDDDIRPVLLNAGNDFIRISGIHCAACDQRFTSGADGASPVGTAFLEIDVSGVKHLSQ